MKAVLITSSILIVLIAALRPLLRGKIDPRVQYALWLAVALRLLIPVNLVTSAYSALALLERAESQSQIVESIGQTTVPLPGMSYEDAYDQALREYHQGQPVMTDFTNLAEVEHRAQELQASRPTLAELAQTLARPVWLGGASVMGLWFLLVNLRLRRKLHAALPVEADCPLPVYVTPELPSPCLCGVFRPAVYVTPAAVADPGRLRHVLAHELTHYRHRDHWWACLRCLCLCLYWFDPLVWWAAALSRQDCELACDEGAIRRLGETERLSYGRTLVDMIAAGRNPLLQTATTMAGSKRRVQERIKLIARKPKTVVAAALALAIVLALAVGCTFTGAPGNTPDESRPGLDTLQARLEDIPEELRGRVRFDLINDEPGHLADYWFDIPAEWTDMELWGGYMLSVGQVSEADLDSVDYMDYQVFARTEDHYFATFWCNDGRFEGYDEYWYAVGAVRDFAEKTVLATEGVEPFSLEDWRADPDTLQDRLKIIPPWLNGEVMILPMEQAVDGDFLVNYWIDRDWTNLDNSGLGWLLSVQQMSEADYTAHIDNGGWEPIARNGSTYYAIVYATDVRFYTPDDAESFHSAFDAIREYAMQQVLATEGTVSLLADSYTESIPERLQPTLEQEAIQTVVDAIVSAPVVNMGLSVDHTGYLYQTTTPSDYWALRLNALATDFQWEAYTGQIPEEILSEIQKGGGLNISVPNGPILILHETANITTVSLGPDGSVTFYQAKSKGEGETIGTYFLWPDPYQILRGWFDEVELDALRTTSVPDRGQSHEEVAQEWAENWEGVMMKCAPGSSFACSYVRIENVEVDLPDGLTLEDVESIVQSHNFSFSAEDFGKIWFAFSYDRVFVPENQNAAQVLMAGNTADYTGDAPEGAMVCSRRGFIWLTDEGWTCMGTGTGW